MDVIPSGFRRSGAHILMLRGSGRAKNTAQWSSACLDTYARPWVHCLALQGEKWPFKKWNLVGDDLVHRLLKALARGGLMCVVE